MSNAVFDYDKAVEALQAYYDGTDYFDISSTGGLTTDQLIGYYIAQSNVEELKARDELTNLDIYYQKIDQAAHPGTNIGDNVNSNDTSSTASTSYDLNIPSTLEEVSPGKYTLKSAVGNVIDILKAGSVSKINIADLGALSLLMCGKVINSKIYDTDPSIWSEKELEKLWGKEWTNKHLLEGPELSAAIYSIPDKNGKVSNYVDYELLGALLKRAKERNILGTKIHSQEPPTEPTGTLRITALPAEGYIQLGGLISAVTEYGYDFLEYSTKKFIWSIYANAKTINFVAYPLKNNAVSMDLSYSRIVSNGVYSIHIYSPNLVENRISSNDGYGTVIVYDKNTHKFSRGAGGGISKVNVIRAAVFNYFNYDTLESESTIGAVINIIDAPLDGVNDDVAPLPDATISQDDTPKEAADKISDYYRTNNQNIYKTYFGDTITKKVPQKDGTITEIKLIKIPDPVTTGKNPVPSEYISQEKPNADTSSLPDDLIKKLTDLIGKNTPISSIPAIGGGTTPTVTTPTQPATALWTIYNPTKAQLDLFGAYLWSTNFLENVKKLMSDPMQAVIGLKSVFMRPKRGESTTIKVGFSDSGVSSVTVPDQYNNLNCGSVDVPEYFGNVLDYAPYTKISLYLPFIGIVQLNPADVLRSTITVEYKGDVLTGACIAEIAVKRDNAGGILYQYSGNMACDYPLTSGNYTAVISAGLNAAGSAIGGAMVGGVPGALLGGGRSALSSLANGNLFNVQQSSGFSGASGVLGGKKPYLIISRPQPEINDHFPELQGYGSNKYVSLSECAGYTRVKAVHVDKIERATSAEKDMIETALKNGVIFK